VVECHAQEKAQAPKAHGLPKRLFETAPGEQLAFEGHGQVGELFLEALQFGLGFLVLIAAQVFPQVLFPLTQLCLLGARLLDLGIAGFQGGQVLFQLGQGLFPVVRWGWGAHRVASGRDYNKSNRSYYPMPMVGSDPETRRLAQMLCDRLRITPEQWHRLQANRYARAAEQLAVALNYLLHDRPERALAHTQQAQGWLDRSLHAPPCPEHG